MRYVPRVVTEPARRPPPPFLYFILFLPFGATSQFVMTTIVGMWSTGGVGEAALGAMVAMNILPSDAVDARLALRTLPALIKGYLRLGAWFGEHAVIDRAFNTTDVLVVLPVSRIDPRYIDYFSEEAGRFAA